MAPDSRPCKTRNWNPIFDCRHMELTPDGPRKMDKATIIALEKPWRGESNVIMIIATVLMKIGMRQDKQCHICFHVIRFKDFR